MPEYSGKMALAVKNIYLVVNGILYIVGHAYVNLNGLYLFLIFYVHVRVMLKITLSPQGNVWRSGSKIPCTFKLCNI
jgi:hypothetical protein